MVALLSSISRVISANATGNSAAFGGQRSIQLSYGRLLGSIDETPASGQQALFCCVGWCVAAPAAKVGRLNRLGRPVIVCRGRVAVLLLEDSSRYFLFLARARYKGRASRKPGTSRMSSRSPYLRLGRRLRPPPTAISIGGHCFRCFFSKTPPQDSRQPIAERPCILWALPVEYPRLIK